MISIIMLSLIDSNDRNQTGAAGDEVTQEELEAIEIAMRESLRIHEEELQASEEPQRHSRNDSPG